MSARRLCATLAASLLLAGPARLAHAADAGADLYAGNCGICHQAMGAGAPGQYPPLRNRIDKIAATPEGRQYLADLLLNGMVGKIAAGGSDYFGYMPAFKKLSDAQLASLLTWLSALGDSKPPPVIAEADIAAARAKPLAPSSVAQERKSLAALHPLP